MDSLESLKDLYFSRPKQEREAFAHHYATTIQERLVFSGKMPFARIISPQLIAEDGLRMQDFILPNDS